MARRPPSCSVPLRRRSTRRPARASSTRTRPRTASRRWPSGSPRRSLPPGFLPARAGRDDNGGMTGGVELGRVTRSTVRPGPRLALCSPRPSRWTRRTSSDSRSPPTWSAETPRVRCLGACAARLERAGDLDGAARCAFWLALLLLLRGEVARAGGWLARAERLVAEADRDCAAGSLLLVPVFLEALVAGERRAGSGARERDARDGSAVRRSRPARVRAALPGAGGDRRARTPPAACGCSTRSCSGSPPGTSPPSPPASSTAP